MCPLPLFSSLELKVQRINKLNFSIACQAACYLLSKNFNPRTETFQVLCTCRPALETTRSSHQRCSMIKVFLKISQNPQENIFAKVSFSRVSYLAVFNRLQALIEKIREPCNFIKKRLCHRCFPVNFAKNFRNTFLTGHLRAAINKLCSDKVSCNIV